MTRLLALGGCLCLLIVVLIHVAEYYQLFPGMGWGLANSLGHYLDLFSALGGIVLMLVAFILLMRRGP